MLGQGQQQGQGKQLTKGRGEQMERRWSKERSRKLVLEEITLLAVSQVHTPNYRKPDSTMCSPKVCLKCRGQNAQGIYSNSAAMGACWPHKEHVIGSVMPHGLCEPHKVCVYADRCSSHNSNCVYSPLTNQEEINAHMRIHLNYLDNGK